MTQSRLLRLSSGTFVGTVEKWFIFLLPLVCVCVCVCVPAERLGCKPGLSGGKPGIKREGTMEEKRYMEIYWLVIPFDCL